MITTIIFDIGNVLVDFCWEPYIESFQFSKEVTERLGRATVLSDSWNEFDRGALSDEEMIQLFIQNDPGIEKEIRMICEDIHDMLSIKEYAISWIQHLKENGYRVLYLSNFSLKAKKECADSLAFMPYMDGGIMSYEVKCIKPDAKIYHLLIDQYELTPSECVFLDDREENCEAAKKLGLEAIVFTSKEAAEEKLEKLGVRV